MTENSRWQPTASLSAIKSRANQLSWVRGFFAEKGVMEVETPVLGRHSVSDIHIDSLPVSLSPEAGSAQIGWLQTSPEYAMKRLLAAGSGPIFQISKVFRAGERGKRHNPEFSMLEWYRPGFSDADLMEEVADLVCGWLDCPRPVVKTYREAMVEFAGLDPIADATEVLRNACAQWMTGQSLKDLDRDACLDLIMSLAVEPALADLGPVFITGYPESQAALARVSEHGGVPLAHRFELYINGLELCNGYWELTDSAEQRARFEADNRARMLAGKAEMPIDDAFLAAIECGIPDCAGVALGLDRLLMLKLGSSDIADVLTFPSEIA